MLSSSQIQCITVHPYVAQCEILKNSVIN
uniref:Uncharacterized protein n=1 Tax=Arundo donax TaxID=35708 RepID=A0A0A9FZL2_ARUDO